MEKDLFCKYIPKASRSGHTHIRKKKTDFKISQKKQKRSFYIDKGKNPLGGFYYCKNMGTECLHTKRNTTENKSSGRPNIIIVGDFNTPLILINRTSRDKHQ
jgi:hypothetical protein